MKFKLKFEVQYPIEKDLLRDMKIDNILSDTESEVISDNPITPPNKSDTIFIGDKEYLIKGISHRIDTDCYTTIIKIESLEVAIRREEMLDKKRSETLINTMRYFK